MKTTIEDLYNEAATIQVKFVEKELTYDVEMFDRIAKVYGDRFVPDCKISHFGYNQYFRTNMGMSNVDKYKSINGLKRGISAAAKQRGLTVESIIIERV